MATDTIRLEGFAETLRNHRLFCVGTQARLPALIQSCLNLVDAEVAHRGRKVLLLQEGAVHGAWLLRFKWDAVFHIKESQDLRLAITYCTHAVKPIRIVWAGGEPPHSVFQALTRVEQVTLFGLGYAPPTSSEWDAVFWTHDCTTEQIEPWVSRKAVAGMDTLRPVLRELQASEVDLVWSAIGEPSTRGCLYWFDATEGSGAASMYSLPEAADMLRAIADSIGNYIKG